MSKIVTKTTTYTTTMDDETILCDATGGSFTITLIVANTITRGKIYRFQKVDASANTVTIDGNGAQTIDGATTKVLSAQRNALVIQCDGTGWITHGGDAANISGTLPAANLPSIVHYLGKLASANFNVTTDQAITISAARYIIRRIVATNCAVSLTTAVGGIYTGAGKTGTAIVAASQVYSGLGGSATDFIDLPLDALCGTDTFTNGTLYFSLSTAQGSAATGEIIVMGDTLA